MNGRQAKYLRKKSRKLLRRSYEDMLMQSLPGRLKTAWMIVFRVAWKVK